MSAPAVARQLVRRDLLHWAAELGAVTATAVAIREGVSPASARGRLAAAERHGQMTAWRLLHGEQALYTVTRAGLCAAGAAGLSASRVSPAGARHAVACCRAAASLAIIFPDQTVLGEPAIRRLERELGHPIAELRAARRLGIATNAHRPDLLLAGQLERNVGSIAVEVELTVKAPERLVAICRAWARSRHVSGVLYLAADEVLSPLARAIETARAGEVIVALPLTAVESGAASAASIG